jgi:signal transduction histidine kinase/ligand-binding sensor domain-containing protein
MHTKRFLFLFSILTFSHFVPQAQTDIKFTHLTNIEGLSQSTVQAIVKDRFGFIWFGTQDGLNRYDGYTFKVYRHQPKDSTSLHRSHILSLCEDSRGNLWVGTSNGSLSCYDRRRDAFVHVKVAKDGSEGLSQKSVTTIYEDKQRNLWIGTYWQLNLLDRETGKITQFGNNPSDPHSISGDGITAIFEDSRNTLWVGTTQGLNILDRKTRTFRRFFQTPDPSSISDNNITAVFEDSRHRLWVGTNNGLNLFNEKTGTFSRFQHNPNIPASFANNQITAIQEAEAGKLWVGTKSSLELFDPERSTAIHFGNDPNVSTSLNKNGCVTALLKDREGILWVGTFQGGLNKHDPHLTYFDSYRNNPNDFHSLSFNVVTAFAEKPNGDVWVGTSGGALNLWQKATNKFLRFNPNPANKNALANWGIQCLYQGKKNDYLWIGMYGSCIDRYDPKTNVFKHYTKGDRADQLNNDAVYAVFEDSKSNIWIGTNGGGVNVLDQSTGVITKYTHDPENPASLASNFVRCFFEDKKGNIWVGGTGGISIFHPQSRTFTSFNQSNTALESDFVFSIFEDSRSNMWIGTLGGGLNKLDTLHKTVINYSTFNGLPDNTINSIVEDRNGYLWISTNNGISRFDPQKGTFKNMGLENGIQSFEFSQGAGLLTRNGEILLGGTNGFNVVHSDQLIKNDHASKVVITGFNLFNKPVPVGGESSPLSQDISETKEIRLSYDQSIITFEFVALNLTVSNKNQYAFMLEGFDKEWNYDGANRRATYTNLSPGTYVFKVKAANNDGLWNENATSIRVVIEPPFWETWWFRLGLIAAAIGSVILLYRTRLAKIKRQKELLEKQVLERTETLAKITFDEQKARQEANEANIELERKNRELEQFAYVASHDLQEPLRTTASFAELLQQQYKGTLDEKADKYLTFIVQASDRMKVLVNDLLEYSRIGRKKEHALVDCGQVVQEVLADLGMAISESKAQLEIGELPVIRAYPTEIKQVFQNLIVNAIKFRKKDIPPQISIQARHKERHWHFTVADNGIGMDMKHSERIFVIFQRLHTRNEYQGSGIGLSHCKKIVELHKGKIWVESVPGEGSCFHFTIRDIAEEKAVAGMNVAEMAV